MLEWYRAGAGTWEIMDEAEALIGVAAESIGMERPVFQRVQVSELLDESDPDRWFLRWVDEIEPSLVSPTIVYDYPIWQAALARLKNGLADRFEIYLGGVELGNAFAEEVSGLEIRSRLGRNNEARQRLGRTPHPVDSDFLEAIDRMPRCSGIAVGIDRLVMVLCGLDDIGEVQVRSPRVIG
jgi:lysyl-tRNA synthetase class 2